MPNTIQDGNKQNIATGKSVRTRSRFKLDYHMFDTFRFGEIHPHFIMECVPGDKGVSVRSEHNLRTYSLSAPLMQKISMKKDYFAVPMEAILPFNWDKIYTNPVQGDDVPDDAGTYVANFSELIWRFLGSFMPEWPSASSTINYSSFASRLNDCVRWFLTAELFYSNGNLLSSLGIHLSHLFTFKYEGEDYKSLDDTFDSFCRHIIDVISNNNLGASYFTVAASSDSDVQRFPFTAIGLRSVLDVCRDNLGTFVIGFQHQDNDIFPDTFGINIAMRTIGDGYAFGLNLARLFAYQIVCAHYYTDDHVDYIYSAELYRQYISSIINSSNSWSTNESFQYNSLFCVYDYLSSFYFSCLLGDSLLVALAYLQAIFGYKHSLRYKDYFVGARTQPLAVGDVNVAVSDQSVSVVDVTRKTQLQRYLNAVNRSGRKFSNYIGELFGVHVAPDYHNPFFLGHTSDDIYGQEIENTAESQQSDANSITAILRSNASRYAFEFDADRPCIIIGVTYFDIPRSYWQTIERQNFHKDRFDMFNPYMQFIGDQKIYLKELAPSQYGYQVDTFGYTNRHMEYKQRYNQCAGGFVQNLPGFAFLNDYGFSTETTVPTTHIGPSFIRSKNTELDRFYLSLTGFSLGSYFHFIVDNYNDVSASRPMVYAPSIL